MTLIPRPPKGREEVPVQISRLLHAHEIVLKEARTMAGKGVLLQFLAAVRGVRNMLGSAARAAEGRKSFDCAAGCEFVDDRIRLPE